MKLAWSGVVCPGAAVHRQMRHESRWRKNLTRVEGTGRPPAKGPASARLLMKSLTACAGADDVLELYAARQSQFTPMHLSAALQRVAQSAQNARQGKECLTDIDTLEAMLRQVGDTMCTTLLGSGTVPNSGVFDARGVADSFWALGRLRGLGFPSSTGTDFPQQTALFLEDEWASLSGRDISAMAMVMPLEQGGSDRDREIILGALERATLGIVKARRDESGAVARRGSFDARSLAITAWAFAKCKHGGLGLYSQLARHWISASLLESSTARDVSTMLWALASAANLSHELTRLTGASASVKGSGTIDSNAAGPLSDFLMARDAAFGASVDRLIALAERSADRGGGIRYGSAFQPHDVAQVLWSFGKVYAHHPSKIEKGMHRLFAAMEPVATGMADKFSSQGLCNVAWAYAVVRHPAGRMLERFECVAVTQIKKQGALDAERKCLSGGEWTFLNIANLLYAFATLGYVVGEDSELLEVASARLEALYMDPAAEISPQSLANAVWSFAVMGFYNLDILREAMNVVTDGAAFPGSGVTLEHFSQLYFACLSLQKELERSNRGGSAASEDDMSAPIDDVSALLDDGLKIMREGTLSLLAINSEYFDTKLGQSHVQVIECLQRKNLCFEIEYVLAEGITCDIAFPDARVAVEVDGPSHYLYGTNELTGKAHFKRRILELLGWTCCTVPYTEWGQLTSPRRRSEYLDGILPPSLASGAQL